MLKFLIKPMKLEKSVVIRILSTTRVVKHRPFICNVCCNANSNNNAKLINSIITFCVIKFYVDLNAKLINAKCNKHLLRLGLLYSV